MKILLVTFPNDLGSRTIEENLCAFLCPHCDMKLFRFAAQDVDKIDHQLDNRRNLARRIQDALRLRHAVRTAVLEGRKILFYNISPALFSLGSWRGAQAYITMDWARRLLTPEARGLDSLVGWVHRRVLKSCAGLLPMTGAMQECLIHNYGIQADRVHRVPSLFDIEHFDPGEITTTDRIRVLFVGGDVKRKGGDLLYEAFRTRLKGLCTLTMVTNHDFPACEGFTLRKGVRYGTPEHLEVMREHDVFVLPTREDAGPQVIGEAAAAGLAVLTTRAALGAPHVVVNDINGVISDSPEACLESLANLLAHPRMILTMRAASLDHMRKHFSRSVISSAYLSAMEG